MEAKPWRCPICNGKREPQFSECWKCGYVRGSGGDEAFPVGWESPTTLKCPTCNLELDFMGTKRFHEGTRAAPFLLGELGELFVNREHFDIYVCSRCGRVEFFLDGIGEEFRSN